MMNEEVKNKSEEQPGGKDDGSIIESSANDKRSKFPPLSGYSPPETAKDPILMLKEIIADKEIDDEGKQWLLNYSLTRFTNRRRMAYWALIGILASLAFLLLGSLHDGLSNCVIDKTCIGILKSLSEVEGLLQWIEGFLAALVATYYGMSSFRPSS